MSREEALSARRFGERGRGKWRTAAKPQPAKPAATAKRLYPNSSMVPIGQEQKS